MTIVRRKLQLKNGARAGEIAPLHTAVLPARGCSRLSRSGCGGPRLRRARSGDPGDRHGDLPPGRVPGAGRRSSLGESHGLPGPPWPVRQPVLSVFGPGRAAGRASCGGSRAAARHARGALETAGPLCGAGRAKRERSRSSHEGFRSGAFDGVAGSTGRPASRHRWRAGILRATRVAGRRARVESPAAERGSARRARCRPSDRAP